MLWQVATSLVFVQVGQGAPTDLKRSNTGGPSQGRQQPNAAPAGNTDTHNPFALMDHYRLQGVSMMNIMGQEDARQLDLYRSPFKVEDFCDLSHGIWESLNRGQDALVVLQKAIPELEGLVGVKGFESPESRVRWSDEELWIDEARALNPSPDELEYRNLLSGPNKMIISLLRESSVIADADRDAQYETKLGRWSDVTFLSYGLLVTAGEGGERNKDFLNEAPEGYMPVQKKLAPTWFLQHDIEVLDELADVVEFCLGTYHKWKLASWPGVTFPIGSFCYLALLGTETGSELAMFFVRHRMAIGRAMFGSVTVFKDKSGKTNLLWWAAYDDAIVERLALVMNVKNSQGNDAARRLATPADAFPYPLAPVRAPGNH
ncbi:hypothetical protein CKM354_001218500 [Cercospora kikuchii]|uniref:Uncharacterized protein n=1 Tax=Cercospora kikuchii TaxID=84275 RepID=A0A9P3L159_9PEZI|nr:uncharacterized protein CKM354_001218500 [Cercospora kikuchii]GIZ49149.1 hypothetical protein CKM354_001218500 [Cercospora kikuchii]